MNLYDSFDFSPVIDLPDKYDIYDFTKSYDPDRLKNSEYGIGRYNEKRPTMYNQSLFEGERNIHMGVDIAAPVNTEIKSFYDGEVFMFANNSKPGDYGYTIITKHHINNQTLYALYGHLSLTSFNNLYEGKTLNAGDVFAWVGNKSDNGGWNPHLHFQLSWIEPKKADMPGAVSAEQHDEALKNYPDPRIVLGPIY